MRSSMFLSGRLACALLIALPCVAKATSYNVVRDFSIKANPNGVWSYQDSANLEYPHHAYQGVAKLENWSNDLPGGAAVSIVRNKTGAPVTLFDGEMTLPPKYLALESSYVDGDNANANVVFTAPTGGTYTIVGNFLGLDKKEAGETHIYIIVNGTDYPFGANAKPYRLKFNLSVMLSAGDTITFLVESNYRKVRHDVGLAAIITGP